MPIVSNNGDFSSKQITVTNNSVYTVTGVTVTFTIPNGLSFSPASSFPAGSSYNTLTNVLTLPTLNPFQSVVLNFIVRVEDIALGDWVMEAEVAGFPDGNPANNTTTWDIEVGSCPTCPTLAGAVDDPNACICGCVADNDTPCNNGTTRWVLDEDSIVNGELLFWDKATGNYRFAYINPAEDITFEYTIWCDLNENTYETSGPATVTIHKLVLDFGVFDHSLEIIGDDLVLKNGNGDIVSTIPICDIVNTCTVITNDELTA